VKALSVRQPHANRIASGEKTIEVRSRRTSHRGPLVIVSSAREDGGPGPFGATVALVELVVVRPLSLADCAAACMDPDHWTSGLFAWELANARPVEACPIKGKLGIYEVDPSFTSNRNATMNSSAGWTYEGYWSAVLGANRSAADVVREFALVPAGLDEWLGTAEAEAAAMGNLHGVPDAWGGFHGRAIDALAKAFEAE
jgi:hypothetical protein